MTSSKKKLFSAPPPSLTPFERRAMEVASAIVRQPLTPDPREWSSAFKRYLAQRMVRKYYLAVFGPDEGWKRLVSSVMRNTQGLKHAASDQECLDAALRDSSLVEEQYQ